jgi:hypothetical protein
VAAQLAASQEGLSSMSEFIYGILTLNFSGSFSTEVVHHFNHSMLHSIAADSVVK